VKAQEHLQELRTNLHQDEEVIAILINRMSIYLLLSLFLHSVANILLELGALSKQGKDNKKAKRAHKHQQDPLQVANNEYVRGDEVCFYLFTGAG
jgi:hypothetical protein